MVPGILGKKIGMTQIFGEDGRRTPVTVVKAGPCSVQAVKTPKKDGYNAVCMGYEDVKEKRLKKPQREDLKARNLKPKGFVREIRCDEDLEVKVGDEVTLGIFQKGDFLDITGLSKGKGFQGGMKRHNWNGGPESHGSMSHRAPGSIGASSYPSRVFKGQSMPGHMGNVRTTIQNVQIVETDAANNTIAVKGAIPGANGTYLILRYAKKKTLAAREKKEEKAEGKTEEKTAEKPNDEKK